MTRSFHSAPLVFFGRVGPIQALRLPAELIRSPRPVSMRTMPRPMISQTRISAMPPQPPPRHRRTDGSEVIPSPFETMKRLSILIPLLAGTIFLTGCVATAGSFSRSRSDQDSSAGVVWDPRGRSSPIGCPTRGRRDECTVGPGRPRRGPSGERRLEEHNSAISTNCRTRWGSTDPLREIVAVGASTFQHCHPEPVRCS